MAIDSFGMPGGISASRGFGIPTSMNIPPTSNADAELEKAIQESLKHSHPAASSNDYGIGADDDIEDEIMR